jgi:hypothetical protein
VGVAKKLLDLAVKAAREAEAAPLAVRSAAKKVPAAARSVVKAVPAAARSVVKASPSDVMPAAERAANLKRWLGNSKVVDEKGEPRRVYHGTADVFDTFSDAKIGKGDPGYLGRGFYFADNPYVADTYSKLRAGPQERVIEAYLALNNPFNWGPKGLGVRGLVSEGSRLPEDIHDEIARRTGVSGRVSYEDRPYAERDVSLAVRELLEGRGYDSVIATDDFSDKPMEFVAFKPPQIKSAIGNRGTYDPNDTDISKARGGLAVKRKGKR